MRKNPKSDYNEENFCYECGNIITADRHFCDKECREAYVNRHKGADIVENLKKQTKFRNKIGLPHHIISPEETFSRYGKISKELPPETQKRYAEHLKVQKEIRDAYLKMKKDSTIETDMDEHKKIDELHHRLEIKSFHKMNKIKGRYLELILLGWEKNREFKCNCGIYRNEICSYKEKNITIKPSRKSLACSILKIEVRNISSQLIGVNFCDRYSQMIDTNGNIHEPHYLCQYLQPKDWKSFSYNLYDGTHAKFYLVLPELEDEADIMRFIYSQSIYDAGDTSGWERDRETFDFKLCTPKVSNSK